MKRRLPASTEGMPLPPAPATSTILGKLPTIREFLTATVYEDNTPRTPGYLWLKAHGITFELTLFDPDSGTRLPVRAGTLDETLTLAEKLLGAENTPWEPDRYLVEQLARKGRKKKAS